MLYNLLPLIVILPAMIYSVMTLICARRYFCGNAPKAETAPDITILKPVKGMDAESYNNFASFCLQDYPGRVQIIFAVAAADDPVISVIRTLINDFPDHDIELVINPAIHGPNYKVSNLINAYSRASHGIIIVCDSDIHVSNGYLSSVAAHFSDQQTGLVTSLYRTSNVHGIATAIEATGFTTEMIPNVMVALQLEGLSFALGASMAVRREALESIGGFEALSDYLADDYQLGNKIHRAGWKIALDSCFVESMMKDEELPSVLSRQLRWARTMRVSRPADTWPPVLPSPSLGPFQQRCAITAMALLAISMLYTTRLGVATYFSRRLVRDNLLPEWLWIIPLRDMLAFMTWALSFLGNRIEWRGSRFRLKPGGKLEELV